MLSGLSTRETRAAYLLRYRWKLLPGERGVPACLSYIVEADRIRLPGNPAGIKVDFPIGDVIDTEDTIVICLLIPDGRKISENVYAIDRSGSPHWRVASQAFETKHGPYVALSFQESVVSLHTRNRNINRLNLQDGSQNRPCGKEPE